MELRVLGPIEVAGDGGAVLLGGPLQRRLLAALVVGAGEARSRDALIDALWGEKPPASASKLLQVYVSQLRRALPAPAHIETRSTGYALKVEADSLDATRFERISYLQVLEQGLKVMDSTAISLCKDNNLPIIIFNLNERGNIRRVVTGEKIGSMVSA